MASGTAIAREGAAAVRENRSPLLAELCRGVAGDVDARLVGEAARRGDPSAKAIVARVAYYSGTGIASLLHLFGPEIVLVGGGVSKLGDLLLEPLRQTTRERVMPAYRDIPIRLAALGGDAGLLGAAALFLNRRNDVEESPFAPEVMARIRQQVLQAYPEMEGAEMTVKPRRRSAQEVAAAIKLGLPVPKGEDEPRYTVILRKDVPAEDGVLIPLTVHVTVDAQGQIVKSREGR
jgi:hypothetical protein